MNTLEGTTYNDRSSQVRMIGRTETQRNDYVAQSQRSLGLIGTLLPLSFSSFQYAEIRHIIPFFKYRRTFCLI